MHGRLRLKTTDQQDAEKKVERAAKARAYEGAMGAIVRAREEGNKDEKQMRLTANVLHSNPDITVLWNIRREILLHMKEVEEKQASQPKGDTSETKEKQVSNSEAKGDCSDIKEKASEPVETFLKKELELTQQCLMVNPKSYGSWHQRFWCLGLMREPDYTREIQICDKYLALDERNFHCWDYRHLICMTASLSATEELRFTEDRINVNFSNYSAWHFRSKLLPIVHPSTEGIGISKEKWLSELDWATEAVFTDPEDSSVWFYHSWLLGHKQQQVPQDVLEKSLESTKELLDLEPDSKWTRLSLILILKKIGIKENFEEIQGHYDKLIEVDPMRRGYYKDMKAKVETERN